jgi:hypothetical protein
MKQHEAEADIDENLVDEARSAYVYFRQKRQPNYSPGIHLENSLVRLVRAATRCGMSPAAYLNCLNGHPHFGKPELFLPNVVASEAAEQAVRKQQEGMARLDMEALLRSQMGILKRSLDASGRSAQAILLDPAMQFTAWFRVVSLLEPAPGSLDPWLEQARKEATPELLALLRIQAPTTAHRLEGHG